METILAIDSDKWAAETYAANFPDTPVVCGSVADSIPTMPDAAILLAGFPCFVAGTMVLANTGYKPIESCEIGDLVLTHRGRWRKINAKMLKDGTNSQSIYEIRAQGCAGILTTADHPFYAISKRGLTSRDAVWTPAAELTRNHRLAQVLPDVSDKCEFPKWLWIAGRFLADGWFVRRLKTGSGNAVIGRQGRIVICCAKGERDSLAIQLAIAELGATAVNERTVCKFHIVNQKFVSFLESFGRLAHGKTLPGWCLELSPDNARLLLEGYLSGDGSFRINRKKPIREVGSVSKSLAYGIALLVQRAFGIVATVKAYTPSETKVIEGRKCKQRKRWVVSWYETGNRSAYVAGSYGWKLVRSVVPTGKSDRVYNIGVEEDESYLADGAIVHNCQPHSLAGKRDASKDPRDGGADFVAAIAKVKPRMFLGENVAGILSSEDGRYVQRLVAGMEAAGYVVQIRTLDAVNFGVPQFRARVWFWGIRADLYRDGMRHAWPKPTHAWPPPEACMFGGELEAGVTVGQSLNLDGWIEAHRGPQWAALAAEHTLTSDNHGGAGCRLSLAIQSHADPAQTIDKPAPALRSGGGGHDGAIPRVHAKYDHDVAVPNEPSPMLKAGGNYDDTGKQGGGCPPVVAYRWSDAMLQKHPPASPDEPSPTVQAKWFKGGAEGLLQWKKTADGLWVRRLTPLECMRLQSGPDDFKWPDGIGKTAMYRIVGNGQASLMVHRLRECMERVDPDAKTVIDLYCGGGVGHVGWHGRKWEYEPAISR